MSEQVYEGLRYLVMTGMSAILSLGLPFILHEFVSVPPNGAVAIGLTTAFVVNFVTAKLFVFKRKGSVKTQLGRYTLVSFIFRSSEYLSFLLLHGVFGIQYMVANASVLFLSFCVKFFVYKIFVFTHREKELQAVDVPILAMDNTLRDQNRSGTEAQNHDQQEGIGIGSCRFGAAR